MWAKMRAPITPMLITSSPNMDTYHWYLVGGDLDITFYRDDFRRRENPLIPNSTQLEFSLENKKVVLVDDVLYTGRSVRAALDALLDFGRPSSVELLVLIDRRLSRHVPIQPDYVGHTVDVIADERVRVEWGKNERVILET